jgi:hypothetical protein
MGFDGTQWDLMGIYGVYEVIKRGCKIPELNAGFN